MPGIRRIDTNMRPCWAARPIKCNPNLQAYCCFLQKKQASAMTTKGWITEFLWGGNTTPAMENKHLLRICEHLPWPSLKGPRSTALKVPWLCLSQRSAEEKEDQLVSRNGAANCVAHDSNWHWTDSLFFNWETIRPPS